MNINYEERLEKVGYRLPAQIKVNNRPFEAGVLKYKGIVGDTITMEEAQDAAKIAFINCLATVRNMMGSIDCIKKIVNIKGYVASTPDFIEQPEVMNEVSALVNEVFGEAGKHSRVSLGTSSLPGGTPVEVEIVVEV